MDIESFINVLLNFTIFQLSYIFIARVSEIACATSIDFGITILHGCEYYYYYYY